MVEPCPRCGAPMVQQRDPATGSPVLWCRRFPACRGTRPAITEPHTGVAPSVAVRLAETHPPRGWDDEVELLVTRFVGGPLTLLQSVLLRLVLVLGVALAAMLVLRYGLPLLGDLLGALLPHG
ncbi:MAG: hypothetical protein ACXWPO_05150 [Candidatus Limnocylindrales bacterium]